MPILYDEAGTSEGLPEGCAAVAPLSEHQLMSSPALNADEWNDALLHCACQAVQPQQSSIYPASPSQRQACQKAFLGAQPVLLMHPSQQGS